MAGLKTKPEYKGLAEAVSLGIALLKKAKQNTWPELVDAMGAGNLLVVKAFKAVDLTDPQLDTINAWQPVLNLVKVAPAVIPVICPVCEHYVLTADTAPSRCMVTAGCEGKPFKVAAATGITAPKTAAGTAKAATATPAAKSATEPKVPAAAARKATPASATSKPAPVLEHIPDDVPEPRQVLEAEPPAGPQIESAPEDIPAATPTSAEPVYDVVDVADDEDPFA
ncbi:hypothetical protein IV500_04510 [Paeniglutamicibacter antarcticus]|uniref:Uncharacterized protein n=1 Tax=Arthrobacter terrae TaxID=2935737 RepID=A0A931CS43_9MICC|nr:hypothetical protein [Arthrobacter terrae]MBG0738683.1 hypothetical protein [Arthrobacter terrae]